MHQKIYALLLFLAAMLIVSCTQTQDTNIPVLNVVDGSSTQTSDPKQIQSDEDELSPSSSEINSSQTPSLLEPPSSSLSEQTQSNSSNPLITQPPHTFKITIPEGYTLARIGMLLEEKGICTAADFIRAAQTGDYTSFPLISEQSPITNRCYPLEGYLYPDTYEFYTDESPENILRTFLTNMEQKITAELREAINASGYTADQIITMASIIEKEAFGQEQMPRISAVLHNRLKEKHLLQCDVTIVYVEGAIKPFITGDVNRYNSDYNTYKCPALPAGAICNPSKNAIQAALSPADTKDFYFVTDRAKTYYYAETWEEHLKNLKSAKQVNELLEQETTNSSSLVQ